MRLRLKEDPREWRRFAIAAAGFGALLAALAWYRHRLGNAGLLVIWLVLVATAAVGWCRPAWVRPIYRGAMTLSHHVGGWIGRVLLAVLFVLVVTPLGLTLRLFGRDLLERRWDREATSYWREPTRSGPLDRLF